PGDVLESYFLLLVGRQFGSTFSERKRLIPTTLHLAHEEDPESNKQNDREPGSQDHVDTATLIIFRNFDNDVLVDEGLSDRVFRTLRNEYLEFTFGPALSVNTLDHVPGHHHRSTVTAANLIVGYNPGEFGIVDLIYVAVLDCVEKLPQHNNRNNDDDPEENVLCSSVQNRTSRRGFRPVDHSLKTVSWRRTTCFSSRNV